MPHNPSILRPSPKAFAVAAIAAAASVVAAAHFLPPAKPDQTKHQVNVLKVIDGDTIEIETAIVLRSPEGRGKDYYLLVPRRVRALGYDAWELAKHQRSTGPAVNDQEVARGYRARAELNALVLESPRFYVRFEKYDEDSFGRLLAELWSEDGDTGKPISVAEHMKKHGHTRPSTPKSSK